MRPEPGEEEEGGGQWRPQCEDTGIIPAFYCLTSRGQWGPPTGHCTRDNGGPYGALHGGPYCSRTMGAPTRHYMGDPLGEIAWGGPYWTVHGAPHRTLHGGQWGGPTGHCMGAPLHFILHQGTQHLPIMTAGRTRTHPKDWNPSSSSLPSDWYPSPAYVSNSVPISIPVLKTGIHFFLSTGTHS